MWRRNAGLLVFSLACSLSLPAAGEPPTPSRVRRAAKPRSVNPPRLGELVSRSNLVQFEVLLGRLTARGGCFGKPKSITAGDLAAGHGEMLTLRVTEGVSHIQYEMQDGEQRVTIAVIDAVQFSIRRESLHRAAVLPLHFEQPATGPLRLEVGTGDRKQTVSAPSLWHLLLAHDELCRRELLPCLELLRNNWRLLETSEQIEQRLFSEAGGANPRELDALVAQLDAPQFAVRQRASQQLQVLGLETLAYFDSLPLRHLSREQRLRIRRLKARFRFRTPDSPERISRWMREDRAVWFRYLAEGNPRHRARALQNLNRICGQQLDFNPVAGAAQRAAQIVQLEPHILRR